MGSSDILNQIAQDARRLRVGQKLPPEGEPIPYEQIALVQQEFEKFLSVTGLSVADVAKRMGKGYSASTISTWRSHTKEREYKGNLDRVTRGVNQFMETYAQQATAPKTEGWVETTVAKHMINVIRKCISLRSMAIISSDSGRGKTLTFKAAESVYPGAVYLRVLRGTRTASGFAWQLAQDLGIRKGRTTRELQYQVIQTLRGTGRVLIIDEAHQLDRNALEFLRDIHDECEIPIVLGGTRKVGDNTDDDDIFFGQFASRVALRYDVNEHVRGGGPKPSKPIHTIEDVKAIFHSDTIKLTSDGVATLHRLANLEGFGGLRLCAQVYRVAAGIAEGKGQSIDAKLLLAVLREMHGKTRAIQRIERAAEELELKEAG